MWTQEFLKEFFSIAVYAGNSTNLLPEFCAITSVGGGLPSPSDSTMAVEVGF